MSMSGMIIATNLAAMNAHKNLKSVNGMSAKASEKLSSGKRINSAADDAAGVSISEKMQTQIRGLRQAQRNTEDAINLIQTMDGAMAGIHDMMMRQRELIVQGLNDTNNNDDRAKIQLEINALNTEIADVAEKITFNKIPLLNVPSDLKTETEIRTEIKTTPITETITETWRDPIYKTEFRQIDEVIVNKIESSVTDPPVRSDGRFKFWASNDAGDIKSQLLYGGDYPGTSHPSIQINGTDYNIWNSTSLALVQETVHDNGVWSTTYGLNKDNLDLTITQHVSIVDNPSEIGGQSYKIDYEVVNNDPSDSVTFDFKYHVDTQLGRNDSAPFRVDEQNITNNTTYKEDNIPSKIEIFDDINNPFVNGVIILNSSGGLHFESNSEPDKVNLGQYYQANTFGDLPGGPVGDSGYSVIWSNRTTTDNEPYILTTYYGVKNPPPEILAGLGETHEVEVIDYYKERTEAREIVVGYTYEEVEVEVEVEVETEPKPLWIQSGANSGQGVFIDRYDCRLETLYKDVFSPNTITVEIDGIPTKIKLTGLVVGPNEEANASLIALDHAFDNISTYRSNAGAQQNRLEFTNRSLGVAFTNLEESNSRIADADMAKEMMNLTKANVLQQAAMAMLTQANQSPQNVLRLLQ